MYLEHQQSVIGAIFLEPSCLDEVSQIVKPEDFDERHEEIYRACLRVASEGGKPDLVTVGGDAQYNALCVDAVPSASNVMYYAKKVADFGRRKRVGAILLEAQEKLRDGEDPTDWLDGELSNSRSNANDVLHIDKVLKETWMEIDKTAQRGENLGYSIGMPDVDKLGMFQDGELVIIAGRPSMGKSVLGVQFLDGKEPGVVFSYEMSNSMLCKRMLASESKVSLGSIRMANFKDADYSRLAQSTEKMQRKPIYFCDASRLSIQDLRAKTRVLVRKHGIKKVVVDYIQLCYDNTAKSREQEISSITRNLKLMAKELNICVIALSQLNRSLENRENKRPRMSDLRESGAIEQDADVILFLYRDHVYNRNAPEREAEIIVGKFRNGEIGFIECLFIGEHQRFVNEYHGG